MASLSLPSVVAFPINQGVALLGGVLLTALIYHEQFTPAKLIGLALGAIVLLLGGLREQFTTLIQLPR
jgi:multidrug transporter EmrE-like cation transporter